MEKEGDIKRKKETDRNSDIKKGETVAQGKRKEQKGYVNNK